VKLNFEKGNKMKLFITALTLTLSLTSYAKPLAQVIERNAHDIMKLVKANSLPAVAVEKLHMVRVTETANGYNLIAVLDHAEKHDQTPAHINFVYDKNLKVVSFQYVDGFINPDTTKFNVASAARLFDLGAEVFLESEDKTLVAYAEKAMMFELTFDADKNAAIFEVISTDNKTATAHLTLDGKLIDVKLD